MTWADRADAAGIVLGIIAIVVSIVATVYARRAGNAAQDANAIAQEANRIAREEAAHVAESVAVQRVIQATDATRHLTAQSARLAIEHLRVEWDTQYLPQLSHRLANHGSATAHDVRFEVLTAAPDRYGPEIGRAVSIAPGDSESYPEWRPTHPVYRDASTVILQLRYRYRDGNGLHTLTVRIGVVFHPVDQHHGTTDIGVVFATLDGAPYDEIVIDSRFGTFVDM